MLKWRFNNTKSGYLSTNGLYYITHNKLTGHHNIYLIYNPEDETDRAIIYDQYIDGTRYAAYAECKRIAELHYIGIAALIRRAEEELWPHHQLHSALLEYFGVEDDR